MAFDFHPGLVWLENTAENAVIMAAGAVLAVISPGQQLHIAWLTIAAVAGKAALCAVLASIVALRQKNGTASFLPRVVAAPKAHGGWSPVPANPAGMD